MTIQEVINKIKENKGFNANLWEKHGKQRIYIDFNFKGSTKKAGFIGKDATKLVVPACGKHTKNYQLILDEIASYDIEWNIENEETNLFVSEIHYSSKAERDRLSKEPSWMNTHDL